MASLINQPTCPARVAILICLAAVIQLALPPVTAWAVQAKPAQESAATQPAASEDVERAMAVIDRALNTCRAANTYQDKLRLSFELMTKEGQESDLGGVHEMAGSLAFAKPNRLALVTDEASVYCDGKHLWVHLPKSGKYYESRAPDRLALTEALSTPMSTGFPPHPVALVVTQPDKSFSELFTVVRKIVGVTAEERGSVAGQRVSGTLEISMAPIEGSVPFSAWFSDATGLLGELQINMTQVYQEMEEAEEDEEPIFTKAVLTITFDDIVIDAEIPADRFVFKPGEDDELVDEFESVVLDQGDQLKLIGEPAPAFAGTDLAGEPLALEELRGRVVLLDFWASWCGPCVKAVPKLQRVADKFADKPVTIIGINRDAAASKQKVGKFLEDRKITFHQLMDAKGEVAEEYQVVGIPTSVLIDAEGVIQDIHVDYPADLVEDFSERIEKLLKGETLVDPEELARRRRRDRDAASEVPTVTTPLEDFATERLQTVSQRLMRYFSGWNTRTVDVDGDGRLELVSPGGVSNLNIISSDGAEVGRIKLKGVRQATIQNFMAVHIEGECYWFVSATTFGMPGMKSSSTVGLFAPDGTLLWTFRPELAEGFECHTMVAAGDLDANGSVEFVVGVIAYKRKKMDERSWTQANQTGHLLVFNQAGDLLCQRRVGQYIHYVHVAPAMEPGAPATLLCFADQRLLRFHLDLTAVPEGDAELTPSSNDSETATEPGSADKQKP